MRVLSLFCTLLFLTQYLSAQLSVDPVFTNNMVLQRNKPLHFFGKGIPGQKVNVSFARENKSVLISADSNWAIQFGAQRENNLPQQALISCGKERITLNNILIGDVWLCFGQSNMEWPMKSEAHYSSDENYLNNNIRFFNPLYAGKGFYGSTFSDSVIEHFSTKPFLSNQFWTICDNSSIKEFSAVAYYFANKVYQQTGVPQGLINLGVGGAPIETFIDINTLKANSVFSAKADGNWLYNNRLPVWVRERGLQNVGKANGIPTDELGPDHPFKPGLMFKNAISHFTSFPLKGFLFYQGESNAQEKDRVNEYAALMQLLVNDYRKQWKNDKLPFYFVQLSSIDTLKYKGQLWGVFRNEQRIANALIPNSGMAVTSDIGDRNDVHPRNKKDVGERLARWALHQFYGKKIVPSGPMPLSAKFQNGKVKVFFKYADGLKISKGGRLHGFSFDGNNEIAATIKKDYIEIITANKPEFVYYAWKSFSDGNLVNLLDLPTSTFKLKVD